jgi:hypothetical protein
VSEIQLGAFFSQNGGFQTNLFLKAVVIQQIEIAIRSP